MVAVTDVIKGSIADEYGIKKGENIISINSHNITDFLDYQFYCADKTLDIVVADVNAIERHVNITKPQYKDLGLLFQTYLMDKQRSCKNKCIFCFIDQLPKGLRKSLYFKDDDTRLSFLFGNYITLTNITQKEIDRIISMHISPINISVHTTNPELRVKMMKNKNAGESLSFIKMLADAGIRINCQLVLCRGINDGDELLKSLSDLAQFYPNIESIAAVPVGLTKFRDTLHPLEQYDEISAKDVIKTINDFGDRHYNKTGDRLVYPADEFYNLAKLPIPNEDFYGPMLQLENGVGMTALFKSEFHAAVESCEDEADGSRKTIATSTASFEFIKRLVDYAKLKWHNINCEVVEIKNDFFGPLITTTGLITGTDLVNQLKSKENLGTLLLSSNMLRSEGDMFLDDMTPDLLEKQLSAKVKIVDNDGAAFLEALLGSE